MQNAFEKKEGGSDLRNSREFISFLKDGHDMFPGREWFADLGERSDCEMYGLFSANGVKCETKPIKASKTGFVCVWGWSADDSGRERLPAIKKILDKHKCVYVERRERTTACFYTEFKSFSEFYAIIVDIERDKDLWDTAYLATPKAKKNIARYKDSGIL